MKHKPVQYPRTERAAELAGSVTRGAVQGMCIVLGATYFVIGAAVLITIRRIK